MTRSAGEVNTECRAHVWYTGHVPTGVEMERQFSALRAAAGAGSSLVYTVIDAFARVPEGIPTAVVAMPSTTTWARGRHSFPFGPKPLRDTQWPWGLPWLAPREQEQVDNANAEFRNIMRIVVAALDRAPGAHVLILHPEQLGPARRGAPATIWDLPELKRWSIRTGMMRAATYQCRFGPTEHRHPVGVLASHCLNIKLFSKGWPTIAGSPASYRGPLPRFCDCGRKAHRSSTPRRTRIVHRLEAPLIKEHFMNYLVGLLTRASISSTAAKLLRSGIEDNPEVHGGHHSFLDSSDDQPTWVPTESDRSEVASPRVEDLAKISWDRELSDILSLGIKDVPTDQQTCEQHLKPHDSNIQDGQYQDQQQDLYDSCGTGNQAKKSPKAVPPPPFLGSSGQSSKKKGGGGGG